MTENKRINEYVARSMLNEQHARARDLTLKEFDMITSCDAIEFFKASPETDILFVYFQRPGARDLNVCFQRCFLNMPKEKAAPLTKADLTAV